MQLDAPVAAGGAKFMAPLRHSTGYWDMHSHSRHMGTLGVVLFALAAPAVAQASDVQSWAVLAGKIDLDPKTEATLDVVVRSNADSFDIGQTNARIGVRRDVGDQWKIQLT